ncbi:MAG: hypothetical protein Q7U05_08285 [Polaromonas sp.]|jgi:hypothetical protein|nr:hypothetical protein [Polaromonas sp.]
MATSSILGGDWVPKRPAGTDVGSLGPSDSTDSGSDARGAFDDDELTSDTDAEGTGERSSADLRHGLIDADILPDHIESVPSLDIDIEIQAATIDEQALLDDFDAVDMGTLAAEEEIPMTPDDED